MTRIRPTIPVTRRSLLAGTIAGAAALRHSHDATAAPSQPRTFVLVHGAWHGGWCWRRVSDRLQQQGHAVFTPTLTGLGERSHLLDRSVVLETHVRDVVNVLAWENLSDVVLVGHSYAGCVISSVAERSASALGAIVFLDAFMPENGQALLDLASQYVLEAVELARRNGETTLAPLTAAHFRVNEADRAWVDSKCTPHPIGTLTEKLVLRGARDRIARKAYIRATGYENAAFDAAYARVRAEPSWSTYEIPCGHDVMVDMPDRLVETLLAISS
jgi:pimeloyl-ACP methyl ester carboxylesterase